MWRSACVPPTTLETRVRWGHWWCSIFYWASQGTSIRPYGVLEIWIFCQVLTVLTFFLIVMIFTKNNTSQKIISSMWKWNSHACFSPLCRNVLLVSTETPSACSWENVFPVTVTVTLNNVWTDLESVWWGSLLLETPSLCVWILIS